MATPESNTAAVQLVRAAYQQAGGRNLLDRLVAEQLVAARRIKVEDIAGLIGDAQAKRFSFTEYLLFKGLLKESELLVVRAAFYKIESVSLAETEIEEGLAKLLDPEKARGWQALPYSRSREGHILVAISDGSDAARLDQIRAALKGQQVDFRLADESELRAAIERLHSAVNLVADLADLRTDTSVRTTLRTTAGDSDAPAVKFLNSLVAQAVDLGASDIHIEPDEDETRVRLRIDGILSELVKIKPGDETTRLINRIKGQAEMVYQDKMRPQDGSFSVDALGRTVKVRVVSMPTPYGEEATMRILDPSRSLRDLSTLGMSEYNRTRYEKATERKTGIAIMTGPTGSGKSTTLYSSLLRIVSPEIKIWSIEDPIELRLPGVSQIEIPRRGADRWGFAEALKFTLRADPDVIMVGEIRDPDTAKLAIQAAITGHFVYSTLHTNDALSAITRLADLGIEHFLLGQTLKVVVAQRLVRTLCEHCKQPVDDGAAKARAAGCPQRLLDELDRGPLYEAKQGGCQRCKNRGYDGRLGIHEVLVVSKDMAQAIEQRALPTALAEIAHREGMRPLREDGFEKVIAGLTSITELNRVAND